MITDDTLREGLQAPGISFSYAEKLELAKLISKCGINRALVSYPAAHISEFNITKEIVNLNLFNEVYSLGRTTKDDVDLIVNTGSNISLHLPFTDFDIEKICDSIKYAKSKGRIVEVAIVDIAKYDQDKLISTAMKFSECGADILQIPDTTGKAKPELVRSTIYRLKKEIQSKIEVHCHNDSGLSITNTIAGIEAGCDYVDTTLLGIGERNGIADTVTIANYLYEKGIDSSVKLDDLQKAYDYLLDLLLSKIGSTFFIDNIPFYGKNVKTLTAGTHLTSSVFPSSYVSLNVYAGSGIIREIIRKENMPIDEGKIRITLNKVKDIAVNEGRVITPLEVVKIYGNLI